MVSATPFYPHWLEVRRLHALIVEIAGQLSGDVIEVGSGDGSFKRLALASNNRIRKYTATDYSTWEKEFPGREPLDAVCSALDLPFGDRSFDCHVSIEVLEHIENTERFFHEAARVLKPGGHLLLTAPFIFRIHPDENSDFFRILPGGYKALAGRHNLEVVKIEANTGMGASASYLVIQWLVRHFEESKLGPFKWIFLPLLPFIFFKANVCGWLIDLLCNDRRFASRFLVILRKPA